MSVRLSDLFQPTLLCEERRQRLKAQSKCLLNFNPRSCARSDSQLLPVPVIYGKFQPTLLCEERPEALKHTAYIATFQPTLLCEERPFSHCISNQRTRFQPTLLCEERQWKRKHATKLLGSERFREPQVYHRQNADRLGRSAHHTRQMLALYPSANLLAGS